MVDKDNEVGWQCLRCGHIAYDQKPVKCSECGCPQMREVVSGEQFDEPNTASVAHFKLHLTTCLNYDINPKTGQKTSDHPLDLKTVYDYSHVSKDEEKSYVFVQSRCARCNHLYTQNAIPVKRKDTLRKLGILDRVEKEQQKWS